MALIIYRRHSLALASGDGRSPPLWHASSHSAAPCQLRHCCIPLQMTEPRGLEIPEHSSRLTLSSGEAGISCGMNIAFHRHLNMLRTLCNKRKWSEPNLFPQTLSWHCRPPPRMHCPCPFTWWPFVFLIPWVHFLGPQLVPKVIIITGVVGLIRWSVAAMLSPAAIVQFADLTSQWHSSALAVCSLSSLSRWLHHLCPICYIPKFGNWLRLDCTCITCSRLWSFYSMLSTYTVSLFLWLQFYPQWFIY